VGTYHAMGGHGGRRSLMMVMVWVWVQIQRKMSFSAIQERTTGNNFANTQAQFISFILLE
jgi:hypothetical protein